MDPRTGPATVIDRHRIDAATLQREQGAFADGARYVYEDAQQLAHAATLKALLAVPGLDLAPDPLGIADHIAGSVGARTLFARIRRVEAGSTLVLDGGSFGVRLPARAVRRAPAAVDETIVEFDLLLGRAVERATRGPCALMLGGGLMSAAVASYAQRAGMRLAAHSLALPDDDPFAATRSVARALGLEAVEHVVGHDEIAVAADTFVASLDAPSATPGDVALHLLACRIQAERPGAALLSGHGPLAASSRLPPAADARPWLRDKAWHGRAAGSAIAISCALPVAHVRAPFTDPELTRFIAALDGTQAPRPLLRRVLAERLPSTLLERAPAGLALAPGALLQRLHGRLRDAIDALRSDPIADVLDLDVIGERVGGHFAGAAHGAALVWRLTLLLLWWAEVLPAVRPRPAAPAPAAPGRQRLVVYTALIGPKEKLANPLADLPAGARTDLELDFVCVTDNPALTSDVWRFVVIPSGHVPPEKLSRRPKALPHEYFPDAEYSLYIDNTVSFKRLPQAADLLTDAPYLFKAFRHATRSNPEQEAAAVASLGYDDVDTICHQLTFYAARRPLDTITPLTTATVLLRAHRRAEVQRFGTVWWESVLAFSKRDQLSFDFALQESGCAVEYFDGRTHDNDWIRWQGSVSQHRVKASFDARRYAWLHRDDPAAQRDPKAHFLAHGSGNDAPYLKRPPLLEFVCHMQGSSLGGHVSPRRAMSQPLQALLAPQRVEGARYLLVRVQGSAAAQAFDAAEHDAAARALAMYLSPARGTLFDVAASDLVDDGKVYGNNQPACDLVVVLGASAAQVGVLATKLRTLLNPQHGSFVVALSAPATLRQAADAEAWFGRELGAAVQTTLQGSLHDDLREPLPNTVLGITWQRTPVADPALAEV